jgi:hypothetical protein
VKGYKVAKESSSNTSGGIGFLGLLTILFIALKLTGHIDWSWWWVLAPIWGTFAIAFVVICVAVSFIAARAKK